MRAFAPLLTGLLAACGHGGGREARSAAIVRGATGHASVTYQPNVRVVEREDGLRGLRGVSANGLTLLFDPGLRVAAGAAPGDIIMIKGLLARRVVLSEQVGGDWAILTAPVSLGELIREGSINIAAPVRFEDAHRYAATSWRRSMLERLAVFGVAEAYAQSPDAERAKKAEEEGKSEGNKKFADGVVSGLFEGWKTTFSTEPKGNQLDIHLTLTKDVGGFRALITGNGYLADFDLSSDIEVREGVVEKLKVIHKRLNGLMNFTWSVAKDSPGGVNDTTRIKLPAALSLPLYEYLGGLPLFLEISSAVVIIPEITGGKEYSHGAFRITYDGTQGFEAKTGNIDSDGNVTGDIRFLESQNIAMLAPLGMVVAFAAPRIELTLGTSKLFDSEDMAKAAEKADKIADFLIKKAYGKESLEKIKEALGDPSMKETVENAFASDAAGYVDLVSSSGMSNNGLSGIFPCTRTELHFRVNVGASAQAFGRKLGNTSTEILKRDLIRVDPPGNKMCSGHRSNEM